MVPFYSTVLTLYVCWIQTDRHPDKQSVFRYRLTKYLYVILNPIWLLLTVHVDCQWPLIHKSKVVFNWIFGLIRRQVASNRLCPNFIFFKIFFLSNFRFYLEMVPEEQRYFFFFQCIVLEIGTAVDIDRFVDVNTGI